jgi:carbamoyl-phosphate synthase large subunit
MLNCNPETVSTDYDTSDRLYFEPLTLEDALNVIEAEQAAGELVGVVVALGGQTPLKLAASLPDGLVLGTSPASIDAAEDRELWNALCARLEIPQPAGGTATTVDDALAIAPATCSAGGRWRSSTTRTGCVAPWPSWPASAASASRAACRRRAPS